MAASSAPDVCLTYSTSLISNYRDLGGLVDLAPYIDSLLPDLKAFLGPDLSVPGRDMIVRDLIPETGAVYSIPARRMNPAGANTFIRKDWLDKLGLPLPTTTQEFYDALLLQGQRGNTAWRQCRSDAALLDDHDVRCAQAI